jgi:uncharacterized metal-binding protein YceD (DUF177 family)
MKLSFNLRHIDKKSLHLQGELSTQGLDLEGMDELIEVSQTVAYDLWIERLNQSVLAHGQLHFTLACQCIRCLKPFPKTVSINDWSCNLPLEGEEKVTVDNDCVDLTPFIREDILLAFPQQPLCRTECSGLPNAPHSNSQPARGANEDGAVSSAWAELNKLKF